MRALILSMVLVGCQSEPGKTTVVGPEAVDTGGAYSPEDGWGEAGVALPTQVAEGLDGPAGIVVVDGVLYVAEQGAGRIVRLAEGEVSTLADGLDAPQGLIAVADGFVVSDAEGIWTVSAEGEAMRQVADLHPTGALTADETHVWWVTSEDGDGEVWRMSLANPEEATIVLSDLDEPGGITHKDGAPVVLESGRAQAIWGGTAVEEIQATWSTDLPGRGIAADAQGVVATTESSRWPNPGWVADLGEDEPVSLCQIPPEPAGVRLTDTHIYFASKQGIGRVVRAGGTLETVALRTSVADFLVWDGQLIWTDPDRGAVWSVAIGD